MKKSTSSLAAVILASLVAAGATTVSMARDAEHRIAGGHRSGHNLRCSGGSADDRGFGGFSGAPGHPFIGPGVGGSGWDDNPFWSPDPYYQGYDDTAYVEPARNAHGAGKSIRHGGPVRHCL